MPNVIEVKEKTVNIREVISFSKHYRDEEHEVFAPKEHATQVLLQLLAVVNQDKPPSEQLVLARMGQVGDGTAAPVDGELLKKEVLMAVARELFDEDTAAAVEIVAARQDPPEDGRVPAEM